MLVLCEKIKEKAVELGFVLVGICRPEYSPEDHNRLLRWLDNGHNCEMAYLNRNPRLRCDPRLFLPGVKSIVSVAMSYYDEPEYELSEPYVSIYARSKPYQEVLTDKLCQLLDYIIMIEPSAVGKIAVDTSPTLDKLWAQKSGIGWRGKNTVVINRELGSFMFLGELFLNIELAPDSAETDHCADCHKCLESCPTGALEQPHVLNAAKCISYLTIEHAGDFDDPNLIGNHVLGCDICQMVCPYNININTTMASALSPSVSVNTYDFKGVTELSENEFNNRFSGTILGKYGFNRFVKNNTAVQMNVSGINDTQY
jgi:epoxyqueuosine reductase